MLSTLLLLTSIAVQRIYSQSAPFTQGEVNLIRSYFEANMDVGGCFTGFVTASPSNSNPDYFYAWQRDTAISMHTLQYTATNSTDFDQRFQYYVTWVLHAQQDEDPYVDVLGEPKFTCNGTVYMGGWCRPQNDGPASRAIALIGYANWLISQGREDYVKQYLYTPSSERKKRENQSKKVIDFSDYLSLGNLSCNVPNVDKKDCGYNGINQEQCESKGCCWYPINPNPHNYPWCFYKGNYTTLPPVPTPKPTGAPPSGSDAIPRDLNYVASVYSSTDTCDLWEEISGVYQFYTSMVQYRALLNGAVLAQYFGDYETATSWNATASQIIPILKQFDHNGFISEIERRYDCSIVLAPLYGGSNEVYSVTNEDIVKTIANISLFFSTYFYINEADDNAGIPGVLLGRYSGDTYTGCSGGGGGSQGHAWILCTNALGDFYYRNSIYAATLTNPEISLTPRLLRAYAPHFSKDQFEKYELLLKSAQAWEENLLSIEEKREVAKQLSRMLMTQGDAQLVRLKYHISSCNYHMSEQICETNGLEVGANDLTWAYGTFLSAWYYRGKAEEVGVTPFPWGRKFDYPSPQSTTCGLCNNQC